MKVETKPISCDGRFILPQQLSRMKQVERQHGEIGDSDKWSKPPQSELAVDLIVEQPYNESTNPELAGVSVTRV